jgi:hypothetical protein
MPTSLAERVFNFTGGRFALLVSAVNLYKEPSSLMLSEYDVFQYIRMRLKVQCHGKKYHVYEITMTDTILGWVLRFGGTKIELVEAFRQIDESKYYKLRETFFGLIKLEVLRYTDDGSVTWHNRCVENSEIERKVYTKILRKYMRDKNITLANIGDILESVIY